MKQSLYTNLEQVQLVNDNVNYNLALQFQDKVTYLIKTESYEDRERLVSALLTLRSFLFETNHGQNLIHITLGSRKQTLDQKIMSYQPIFNLPNFKETLTLEFEITLLHRLALGEESAMDEILANCNFYSINEPKCDPALAIQSMSAYIDSYLEVEENQPEDIEEMLINNKGCQARILDLACQAGGDADGSSSH